MQKTNEEEENSTGSSEPECLTCSLTYYANETETEISLFLRKHPSVTGRVFIQWPHSSLIGCNNVLALYFSILSFIFAKYEI
jgi:hypothetical protein